MALEIKKAVRRALPLQIAFYGPSGSGKTFSALRFAAGLANGGKVAVIDTERGRASLYSDNRKILTDLPAGFDVVELDPPYHPERYIEALDIVEAAGYKACLIDSVSDSWDGPGGCTDLAEKSKGMWNIPKLWNKRLMMRLVTSDMHTICCLKAQDKTKIVDKKDSASGKQEYIGLGMQPICEKNFFYPMLLGFSVDPKTHVSAAVKVHDDLVEMFQEPRIITKQDGERVRSWNEGGQVLEKNEQLKKRAIEAAHRGMDNYAAFFKSLPAPQKKALVDMGQHNLNKTIAETADAEAILARLTELESSERFYAIVGNLGYENIAAIPVSERVKVCRAIETELGIAA